MKRWGGRRDLNPQRPEPQSGALPIELLPPFVHDYSNWGESCQKQRLTQWQCGFNPKNIVVVILRALVPIDASCRYASRQMLRKPSMTPVEKGNDLVPTHAEVFESHGA